MRKNQIKIIVTSSQDRATNEHSGKENIIGAYADDNNLFLALLKAFVAITKRVVLGNTDKGRNKFYKKIEEFYAESACNEVYILCMVDFDGTQIYGVFTDKDKLTKSYNLLLEEDERCSLTERYPQKPIIYRMPINQFTAFKLEGCTKDSFLFYDQVDDYQITIEDIRRE